jgi:predicted CXXCH cytochrome family protein
MSFIVRQISRTADGREIVRTASHSADSVSIGRDSSNVVHLADLAVDMVHARLTRLSAMRVLAEASGSLGFEADSKSTSRVEIDAAIGSVLRFGGHKVRVASEGDDIVLTVSREEAVSDSAEARDEQGLFTLKNVALGRRPLAWALAGLVLLLFLAWPIYTYATSRGMDERGPGFHADEMWSSGSLSLAHKSLKNDCQACHVNKFEAVTDKTCMTCHKDDAHNHAKPERLLGAKAAPGLGGSIRMGFQSAFGIPQGRCVECHTEHEGAGKMPATAQQFCADCHGSLKDRLHDSKLGNASDFGTLHPQLQVSITSNPGGMDRQTRRVPMTGGVSEDNGLKFPHDIHLSKTNGIARMAQTMAAEQGWGESLQCKDCHVRSADGTRFKPVDMEEDCQMCHSLAFDKIDGTIRTLRHGKPDQVVADLRAFYRSTGPARPINLSGMARRRPGDYAAVETATDYSIGARQWPGQANEAVQAVFSRGGACYDCHSVMGTATGFAVKKVFQPARYFQKGWFDHEAHNKSECTECHKAGQSKSASDLILPDLASCRTCHVGGTGASLASVKKPVESSCAMCHDYHMDDGAPRGMEPDKRSAGHKLGQGRKQTAHP